MKRPYLFDIVQILILILLVVLLTSCSTPETKSVPMPMPMPMLIPAPPPAPKPEPLPEYRPEAGRKSLPESLIKSKPGFISEHAIAYKQKPKTKPSSETFTTPKSIGIAINDFINSLYVGKVEYRVEEKMVEGESTKVEAWIAKRFTEDIATTLRQRGFSSANIKVGTSMGMSLNGSAFKIDPPNDIEKSIGDQDIGKWQWDVVPLRGGQQKLTLTACVLIKMENIENIPPICEEVFSKEFDIEVNRAYKVKIFVIHNWEKIIGFIISSGVIGYLFNKKKRKMRKKKT
ncbi:MAG: hypothetical protein WC855_06030 [Thermodesulfovibrionales bacterium]